MSNLLIPLQSIVVRRDGTFKIPEINKPFAFEAEEIQGLEENVHYRKPVVEAPALVASADETDEADSPVSKPAAKTAVKGKKANEESL